MIPAITKGTPASRHLDGAVCPLVRVDPTEEEQVLAGRRRNVTGQVDSVMDGGRVAQAGWRSASLMAT